MRTWKIKQLEKIIQTACDRLTEEVACSIISCLTLDKYLKTEDCRIVLLIYYLMEGLVWYVFFAFLNLILLNKTWYLKKVVNKCFVTVSNRKLNACRMEMVSLVILEFHVFYLRMNVSFTLVPLQVWRSSLWAWRTTRQHQQTPPSQLSSPVKDVGSFWETRLWGQD